MIKIKLKEAQKSSSSIWAMERDQKYKGEKRMSYIIKHIPSNSYVPRAWLGAAASDRKSVKDIIELLNGQTGNWQDVADKNPGGETFEAVYELIHTYKSNKAKQSPKNESLMVVNEALTGLMLPDIINTKIMEDITINANAQETFGRFIRDWAWNWFLTTGPGDLFGSIVWRGHNIQIVLREIFGDLYKIHGGNVEDLEKPIRFHHGHSPYHDGLLRWLGRLTQGNPDNTDVEKYVNYIKNEMGGDDDINTTTVFDFRSLYKSLWSIGSSFYESVDPYGGPQSDPLAGGAVTYSYPWKLVRRATKSAKKAYNKKGIPRFYQLVEDTVQRIYLRMYTNATSKRRVRDIIDFLNKDGKNWVEIDKILKDPQKYHNRNESGELIPLGKRDSLDGIDAFIQANRYNKHYETRCSDVSSEIAPSGEPCVMKEYDDGFFWFSRGKESCDLFGKEGRNCGSGAATLIDLQRKVHRGENYRRGWYIGIDYHEQYGFINQILGLANSFPREKYWTYIKDFIDTYDIKDVSADAFNYLKDEDEVTEEEIYKFIMAVANDAVKDHWELRKREKEESTRAIVDDIMARAGAGGPEMFGYEDHPDVLRWTGGDGNRQRGIATAARYLRAILSDFEDSGFDDITDLHRAQANAIVHTHGLDQLRLDRSETQLYNQFIAADVPPEAERNWRGGMPTPANEDIKRWKRNLNYQPPKKIDAKKAHAVQSWYKNKRNKIK